MPKLHMRLSVELEVTEEQLINIVENARNPMYKALDDVEYAELPHEIQAMIDIKRFEPCDWDEGGYIPDEWLRYDAEESGLYEVSEHGVIRKENVK